MRTIEFWDKGFLIGQEHGYSRVEMHNNNVFHL